MVSRRSVRWYFLTAIVLLTLSGCQAGKNEKAAQTDQTDQMYEGQSASVMESGADYEGESLSESDTDLPKEWEQYLASQEPLEQELIKKAYKAMGKYMDGGSNKVLPMYPNAEDLNEDIGFPEHGYMNFMCVMRNQDLSLRFPIEFNVWISSDGTVIDNYPQQLFNEELLEVGLRFQDTGEYDFDGSVEDETIVGGSTAEDVDVRAKRLFIDYAEYSNIPAYFRKLSPIFKEIWEQQKENPSADYSLLLKFGEFDSFTNLDYYGRFCSEYPVDFKQSLKEWLPSIEKKVKTQELAFMKDQQPERYQAIMAGGYLSRADYIKPYRIPWACEYAHPSGVDHLRKPEKGSVLQNAQSYQKYRERLKTGGGKAVKHVNEEWPEYSFLSLEKLGWLGSQTGYRDWDAICNDLFCLKFPTDPKDYSYGSTLGCADRVFASEMYTDEEAQGTWMWDMGKESNRRRDKGRLYLFAINGKSPLGTDPATIVPYLETKEIQDKIDPFIYEPVDWKPGRFQSIYHDYLCAEGTTSLRNVTVYAPVMGPEADYHWIFLFEEFKESRAEDSIYKLREEIMKRFVMLPFWYECRPGDTLGEISERYTGSAEHVRELSEDPLNQIGNPDRIYPGEKIEIPPDLLLRKRDYECIR